jgi:signal transduction histidine kinase
LAQIDREFNKLLALATSEDSETLPAQTRFTVASTLDPLIESWRAVARRKGIALHYVPCSAVVESQPEMLATIIGNLVSNAVKYTARGRVLVGCRRRDGGISIEVLDTGIGIDPSRVDAIFEAFQQGDTGSEGLGLGLWIASRTATMLGHSLTMTSTPGRGTRFSLRLSGTAAQ